ncbi:MAG: hypothetical protein ACXVNO_09365 [Bacteroidia bacterium]
MNKNILMITLCLLFSITVSAQSKISSNKKTIKPNIFTGIKPPDGYTYTFGSKEEKDASVPSKRNNVIAQIKANQSDSEKVKLLRMELWRLDNATIIEPK